ncbi:hypothetical protein FQA39_LY12118 [Lamprigera yunnana]|nr:hypothetical protein FQA39_LY12118 [Lamprigera yunnana]
MDSKEEKMLKLIELYKNKPVIWNMSGPDNLKELRKELAWAKISIQFGESIEKCKKRIKKVLSERRREKLKMKEFEEMGIGYVSKWYALEALEFLPNKDKLPKQMETKRLKLTMPNENMERTANPPSDYIKLEAFTNYVTTKMDSYSKKTREEAEHHINKILVSADQGYYEQRSSDINQPSTSFEPTQHIYSEFLKQQIEFYKMVHTTNPKVSMQSSDENSAGSEI